MGINESCKPCEPFRLAYIRLRLAQTTLQLAFKAVLHGTTCNVNFSRNNVARKIEHRCEFLNSNQKLATRCRVKCCAKNRPRHHVTRRSIFRATMLRKKSTLQVVPCNAAFKEARKGFWRALAFIARVSLDPNCHKRCARYL